MNQSTFIVGSLFFSFLLYITAKGELSTYLSFFTTTGGQSAAAAAGTGSSGGTGLLGSLGSLTGDIPQGISSLPGIAVIPQDNSGLSNLPSMETLGNFSSVTIPGG
jgi:hypothetical protein